MLKRTVLFDMHRAAGAKMVDFGGWEMPLHYGSQIEEHLAVRSGCGMFDVSHMRVVDVAGADALRALQLLLANDAGRLVAGKALYSCMLRHDGGVLDDLIVYRLADDTATYRLVVNAGTADRDLAWLRQVREERAFDCEFRERSDLALIAVQGPNARACVARAVPQIEPVVEALGVFCAAVLDQWFIARTGYTGEDGFEIALPESQAAELWQALAAADVAACGLGARDTLRLEAGMNLYGNDMDESTHPYESGLGWTVALEPRTRGFIGRAALEEIARRGSSAKLVGLLLEDRGVLRSHQRVLADAGAGEITSGTFSPTLERSIAFARVPAATAERVQVDIRGKLLNAKVVKPPFVRNGKSLVT